MKRVLITGASGFVGSHLVELLMKQDYEVYGTVFGETDSLGEILDDNHVYAVNMLEADAVLNVVEKSQPEWVIHLAALTSPAASFSKPAETLTNNITAQVNLCEALLTLPQLPRTLIIGSAEEYGAGVSDKPADENTPLRPLSPYAVSKIAQDYLGLQYFLSKKLPVIRLRPFNHTGPRQTHHFVLPAFAKQVAEIEAGLCEPILQVGNLSPIRDFTDVTDMVRAYVLALEYGEPGKVYNVGSGVGVPIQQLVDYLLELSTTPITIVADRSRFRPAEVQTLIADSRVFCALTGWRPTVELKDTVAAVLDYWRSQVASDKKQTTRKDQ